MNVRNNVVLFMYQQIAHLRGQHRIILINDDNALCCRRVIHLEIY